MARRATRKQARLIPLIIAVVIAGVGGCLRESSNRNTASGTARRGGTISKDRGNRAAAVSSASQKVDQAGIGSFNIEWFSLNGKKARTDAQVREIAYVIRDTNCALMGLGEVQDAAAMDALVRYLPGYRYVLGQSGGQQHCAILWDTRRAQVGSATEWQEMNQGVEKRDGSLRDPLVAPARVGNFDFTFVVLHNKALFDADAIRTRRAQFRQLRRKLDETLAQSADKDAVIVGDMNDFADSDALKELTTRNRGSGLDFIVTDARLPDTDITHLSPNGRIDHVVVTSQATAKQEWTGQVETYPKPKGAARKAYDSNVSDHLPIWATFDCRQDRD